MAIKSLVALLAASTLIGCSDKIDVSNADKTNAVNGKIVFNRLTDPSKSINEMFLIDSTGSALQSLGNGMAGSTNGDKMVYMTSEGVAPNGSYTIHVSNADGSQHKRILTTNEGPASLPIISADGSKVVYTTFGTSDQITFFSRLHVVDVATGVDVEVSQTPDSETLPSISPDGKQVVYFSNVAGNATGGECDLVVVNSDGTNPKVIRQGLAVSGTKLHFTAAAWSPKGDKIAYSSKLNDGYAINLINVDGTDDHVIGQGFGPVWSYDGQSLAWTTYQTNEIMYTSNFGATTEWLTSTTDGEGLPQFSPDGKKILCTQWFNRDDDPEFGKLFIIDIESKVSTQIADSVMSGFWLR
jgi:Tol biopolymer transport system component